MAWVVSVTYSISSANFFLHQHLLPLCKLSSIVFSGMDLASFSSFSANLSHGTHYSVKASWSTHALNTPVTGAAHVPVVEVAVTCLLRKAWPKSEQTAPLEQCFPKNVGSNVASALPPPPHSLCWTYWQYFLLARSVTVCISVFYIHASVCFISFFLHPNKFTFPNTHLNPLTTV